VGCSLAAATVATAGYTVWLHLLIWVGLMIRERGLDVLRWPA
jgi:hypothetical protein